MPDLSITPDGITGHGMELYVSSNASLSTTATTFMTNSQRPSGMETGPYLLTVKLSGGGWYSESWSGIMQWYSSGTNSSNATDIHLTGAGHAPNNRVLYARFKRQANNANNHALQLWSNMTSTSHTLHIYATKLSRQGW